jgi:hypothetical protein
VAINSSKFSAKFTFYLSEPKYVRIGVQEPLIRMDTGPVTKNPRDDIRPALLRVPVELLNKVEPGYQMQRIA